MFLSFSFMLRLFIPWYIFLGFEVITNEWNFVVTKASTVHNGELYRRAKQIPRIHFILAAPKCISTRKIDLPLRTCKSWIGSLKMSIVFAVGI